MSNIELPPNLPLPPVVDYTSRDYSSVLNDLINLIPTYLPEWTDRSPGDFGIVLLELYAYVCDIMNFYIDRAANEAFLATATQYQSILNIAQLLDYTPFGNVAATASLQFTIANPSPSPVIIPAGTVVTTNPQQGQTITFTTKADLTVWGDNNSPTTQVFNSTGVANQQVLLTGPFDGSTVTVTYLNTTVDQINGGTAAINNGTSITSIRFKSLPVALATSDTLTLSNGTNTLALSVTGGPYAISSSTVVVTVTSVSANATYTPGSATAVGTSTAWTSYEASWVKAPSNSFTGVSSTGTDFIVVNSNTVQFGNNVNGVIPGNGSNFNIIYYPWNGSQYSALTAAIQATQVNNETVGISTGNPNQSFTVFQSPVVNNSVVVSVTIAGVTQQWQYFTNLVDAGSSDLAYTTSMNQNGVVQVTFGDGVNGLVPVSGATITASYQVGGGAAGNVAANTIVNFSGVGGVISVTNPQAATGGADAESVQHIRTHAPLSLTALNRAVTVADYASLALSQPSIAKASALAGSTGTLVSLYIHPTGGFFTNITQLSSVVTSIALSLTNSSANGFLDTRKIANVTVSVSPPQYNNGTTTVTGYVPVNMAATVQVLPNYTQSSVQAAVNAAVANLFSFSSVDFGSRITLSSLYQAILSVPGVEYAIVTNLARQETAQPVAADVVCATYEIPQLNLPNQPVITMQGGINY